MDKAKKESLKSLSDSGVTVDVISIIGGHSLIVSSGAIELTKNEIIINKNKIPLSSINQVKLNKIYIEMGRYYGTK